MDTINISLPKNLKKQSEMLIEQGYYASFSDLVRSSLRNTIRESKYDTWSEEAKKELASGQATILKDDEDIKSYIKKAKRA